ALLAVETTALLEATGALFMDAIESGDTDKYPAKLVGGKMPFQPVFDTLSLPLPPQTALAQGAASDLEILMGVTHHEFSVVMAADGGVFTPDVAKDMDVVFNGDGQSIITAYRDAFPGISDYDLAVRLESDKTFTAISFDCADRLADTKTPIWFYRFDWETPQLDGALGAHHFLELPFVFNQMDTPQAATLVGDERPYDLARTIHAAWVAFIKTGDPNHDGLPAWPNYTAKNRETLLLKDESTLVSHPFDPDLLARWRASTLL
ncbi:MAG: carboxylesterase family protein, partial [Pseudomonadota bacterium]